MVIKSKKKAQIVFKIVFEVADHDFVTILSELKMVDPIWRSRIRTMLRFFSKLEFSDF